MDLLPYTYAHFRRVGACALLGLFRAPFFPTFSRFERDPGTMFSNDVRGCAACRIVACEEH